VEALEGAPTRNQSMGTFGKSYQPRADCPTNVAWAAPTSMTALILPFLLIEMTGRACQQHRFTELVTLASTH
jgi:hypothetical protein